MASSIAWSPCSSGPLAAIIAAIHDATRLQPDVSKAGGEHRMPLGERRPCDIRALNHRAGGPCRRGSDGILVAAITDRQRQHQQPTLGEHPLQLREDRFVVGSALQRTEAGDGVEASAVDAKLGRASRRESRPISMPPGSCLHRLGAGSNAQDRTGARLGQERRAVTGPAADVEDGSAPRHVGRPPIGRAQLDAQSIDDPACG